MRCGSARCHDEGSTKRRYEETIRSKIYFKLGSNGFTLCVQLPSLPKNLVRYKTEWFLDSIKLRNYLVWVSVNVKYHLHFILKNKVFIRYLRILKKVATYTV
jgi:hypothetical protein